MCTHTDEVQALTGIWKRNMMRNRQRATTAGYNICHKLTINKNKQRRANAEYNN